MKKKILLIASIVMVLACLFVISVSAEDKIIKLDTIPTLEEIHANPEAYVSHLDAFDGDSLGEKDSTSVTVLSDLAETPTYYVFPSYYYMRTTNNMVWGYLTKLNEAIAEADSSAFAGYAGIGGSWSGGGCKYLIRYEVPTYVTSITGTSKFEGDSNLLEVYFPTHMVIDEETGLEKEVAYVTSISGENLFSSCPKLEYIHNMGKLPIGIVQGNNAGFSGCRSLREIEIPEGVTTIPSYMFSNCSSLTEVVLSNSVKSMGKQAFASCTSLVSIKFSASFTTFFSSNNDYETFLGTNNLKYVYLPATFADSITATNNNFKNIFSNSSKVTYFFVGSKDKAIETQDNLKATNANQTYANATIVEFDPSINYTGYADSLGYSIIVYNYSACEAFYNGEHDVADEFTLEYEGAEYLSKALKSKACSKCVFKVDATELAPLFKSLGYSTNGNGGLVQGFAINVDQLGEYEEVIGTVSYGVIAARDKRDDKSQGFDVFALENYISHDFTSARVNGFEIKITGITEADYNTSLFVCAYAKFGGETYYINNGVIDSVALSTTYNAVSGENN